MNDGICENCGHRIGSLTAAQIALRNAVLTPEQDAKVREFVDFIIWQRKKRKKRKKAKP